MSTTTKSVHALTRRPASPTPGTGGSAATRAWVDANYFTGSIDDVAIYNTPLTSQQVDTHYVASGRTSAIQPSPSDSYGAAVYAANPDLYWRLDDSGAIAQDSGTNGDTGNYQGGVTQQVSGALSGTTDSAAAFDGNNAQVVSTVPVSNPTVYSLEAWFKTTTTTGGKIIGFGDATSGNSSNYDRHIYMQDDGTLAFGVWTGQPNLIISNASYNDGSWHHVVGSQGPNGMQLYVDGQLIGINPQTQAQSYTGYWRVGGDNTWSSSSSHFAGKIDEVAVYSSVLSGATIVQHYSLGVGIASNVAPTAAFSSSPTDLTVTFDASASNDPDGSIASYAWDFGDGTTGTGVAPVHSYPATGSYTAVLTVTDNKGATNTVSHSVSVLAANVLPIAKFVSTVTNLGLAVDGTSSSDPDGTVSAYSWNFGDGSAVVTGPTASHVYATAGTYAVVLTVTDDRGGQSTSTQSISVAPVPNQAPTAAFSSSTAGLTASFDGTGSLDSDGTVASYAWNFGDGATGTGATPSHTYAVAGPYTVTLTVTDNGGLVRRRSRIP